MAMKIKKKHLFIFNIALSIILILGISSTIFVQDHWIGAGLIVLASIGLGATLVLTLILFHPPEYKISIKKLLLTTIPLVLMLSVSSDRLSSVLVGCSCIAIALHIMIEMLTSE